MLFKPPLRVAINAQLMPEHGNGGILTVLKTLAALAHLPGHSEQYVFIGPYTNPEWLREYLPREAIIVRGPPAEGYTDYPPSPFRKALWHKRPKRSSAPHAGFFEHLEADVVHFPFQRFEPCNVPTIFNPHDLQHLHYPEFFSPEEQLNRERIYRSGCDAAEIVVVGSVYVKNDLVRHYDIQPSKVLVIPWAPPPLPAQRRATDPGALRRIYGLPPAPFAIYPAMTWEHKNHIRLLEAFAQFRRQSAVPLSLVCTGKKTDHWPRIQTRLSDLALSENVVFTDLIPDDDLHALYSLAQFTIIPTMFEAASGPMFESWQHGTPVACASVTSLPTQAAGAALLFNPLDSGSITSALIRMTTEAALRRELRDKGVERLKDFSLEKTIKAYRAAYRMAAGRRLNREDELLLNGRGDVV